MKINNDYVGMSCKKRMASDATLPLITGQKGNNQSYSHFRSGSRIRVFRTRKRTNNLPKEVKHDIQKK